METVYMDNAAATRVLPEVLDAMLPYFTENYGNSRGVYQSGFLAAKAVRAAREQAGKLIGAEAEEIYFTSGGTEADNWALKSVAEAYRDKGRHIITSSIEHHAIIRTCEYLKNYGCEVTYLPVDRCGSVSAEDLEAAIRPDTVLVSVMAANNEVGTLQPIKKIGEIARRHGVLFHTDAVAAYGHIPIDVKEMNIDLLSAGGHKLNGPKGIGILYAGKNVRLEPLLHGGVQESGKRAGTLNVPAIVGMGQAAFLAGERMKKRREKLEMLREHLIGRVLTEIPYSSLNGDPKNRLSGNAHFSFRFVESESVLLMLDAQGICASGGSACTAGTGRTSHVLSAMGISEEFARGSLRLTLSEENTFEQVDYVVDKLKEIIETLRGISLSYRRFMDTL